MALPDVVAVTFPGGWELIVILFIVLLLFGAKRLPDLASSLGRSARELRRAATEDDTEATEAEREASGDDPRDRDGGPADR
jgi:sec-independent protein translocase protein TatA